MTVSGSEPTTAERQVASVIDAVEMEARDGLQSTPRTLAPWLFYDELGSQLFSEITRLPEYYLTRTERELLARYAKEIVSTAAEGKRLTLVELGAGTAEKTGVLLQACLDQQGTVVYAPIDVSKSALDDARANIERDLAGVTVRPQTANYVTDALSFERSANSRALALYIGSSIGNFAPEQATSILRNLRNDLVLGDRLLLGTDLGPSTGKSVADLLAAYDDAAGVTAAFNRNILTRLNRDLGSDFDRDRFAHRALWNEAESRIEMHLVSEVKQAVTIPRNSAGGPITLQFAAGETIHTENSYKFNKGSLHSLLTNAGFSALKVWTDDAERFAVTLATAI